MPSRSRSSRAGSTSAADASRSAIPADPTAVPIPAPNATCATASASARSSSSAEQSRTSTPSTSGTARASGSSTINGHCSTGSPAAADRLGQRRREVVHPLELVRDGELVHAGQHRAHVGLGDLDVRGRGPRVVGPADAFADEEHERADHLRAGALAGYGVVEGLDPAQQLVVHRAIIPAARRRSTSASARAVRSCASPGGRVAVEVPGRVPLRRAVAAPHVPAGQAQPQVHPRRPVPQALLAPVRRPAA